MNVSLLIFYFLVELIVRFPIPQEEIDSFKSVLGTAKPAKPYAFIFGHGLWNVSILASLVVLQIHLSLARR